MKLRKALIPVVTLFLVSLSSLKIHSQELGWTHFRGSNLDGYSQNETVPKVWNDTTHIVWKTPIDGIGWSSPVVLNNQIWLTTAPEGGEKLFAVCIDFGTGKIIHQRLLFKPDTVYGKHAVNTYATPTPCVEEGFVYIHFGSYGTACLETATGTTVWSRTDLHCDHAQGPGSSPIIYKDKLILHYEGVDVQYLVALDKKTGKTLWKTERPKVLYEPLDNIGKKAYITPIVITVNGIDLLISNGAAACIAYNVETGQEVWRIVQGEDSTISMPITENGKVYFYTSFVSPVEGDKYCELLAVDPSGNGDVSQSHILWRQKAPILQLSTPIIIDGLIYTVDTKSNLFCLDAKTGEEIYTQKVKGKYHSSPIGCNGNIYFAGANGKTLVIQQGKTFHQVAENALQGQIWATPAVYRNSLLIRTSEYLYRIGE